MARKKTDARLLEQYIEKEEGGDASLHVDALDEETRLLVDSLRQWQKENGLQPRVAFAQELAQDLQAERSNARRPWVFWPALSRILAGGVSLAVLLLFAFFISGLFRGPVAGPAPGNQATPSSQVALTGAAGLFEGVQFLLDASLGEERQELATYVVDAAPLPETAEEVLTMALAIGMENPRVYRSQGAVEGWLAIDDAGRRLSVDGNHVRFPLVYHAAHTADNEGATVGFTEASSLAVQFLERGGLLPEEYEVREQLPGHADGLTRVEIVPTLDGHPVHYVSSEVTIGANGTVIAARIHPLTFKATGETVAIQAARAAFDEVLESHVTIDGRRHSQVKGMTTTYFPTFGAEQQGATVTLIGYVNTLLPAEETATGAETIVELSMHPETANSFRLRGAVASNVESEAFASVTGVLREPLPGGVWQIEVSEWQALDVESAVQCQEGVLNQVGDEVVFVTGEDETFTLPYPPEVMTGEAAVVCAAFSSEPEAGPIAWLAITSPLPSIRPAFSTVSEASELEPALEEAGIPETLLISWATPGYVFSPALREDLPGQRLAPAWLFYGQDLEGTAQFVLRVPIDSPLDSARPGS